MRKTVLLAVMVALIASAGLVAGPAFADTPAKSFSPDDVNGRTHSVPEPATMILLGAGLVGLAGFSLKKFKK